MTASCLLQIELSVGSVLTVCVFVLSVNYSFVVYSEVVNGGLKL